MRMSSCVGLLLASVVFLPACNQQPNPVGPKASLNRGATNTTAPSSTSMSASPVAALSQELAALKQASARFHDLAQAEAAGWSTQLTPCLSLAGAGAQGFHYANAPLIDGTITPLQPELLLYEPRGNSLHLVGVEYIIPFAAWTGESAPTLYGETFHRNEALGLWALHVWIWQPNPSGMFADWNPNVSCPGA